ncbi:E3 ubiquitin-protein ligase TTC3 [Anoplophora glabripennis]|uniref:E3 ubiquitin-protein ligase TTC3 n=1 Tax=Anoplophora glabripennis TaxID=217634 RepID=UPI000874318D|nr:E3 ubiquitin-protein ligase TTC3 [Anoplophora glabripennis]
MDASTKNIFQQFLIEEFEKQKDKKMDVVATKRKQFKSLLDKAENELRNKSYDMATKNYYSVIHFLKKEPYPDELQLSVETDYSIKCCFCYSALMNPDRFKDEEISSVLLDVIKELNNKFITRLFPMFLLVLLNFHRKNWLTTLTWCNEIADYIYEEESDQGTEIFKELLPEPSEIRHEVDRYEEIAFFGYGEKLTRNIIFKPRFEKYKTWGCKIDDFVANKTAQLQSPISETELHTMFHHEIFPMWCLASGENHKNYYNDKFATKCTQCMHAKLYNGIPRKNELGEDHAKFEKYVAQCAEFYQKYACGTGLEVKKIKDLISKKQTCSTMSQTERPKNNHKHIQTEGPKTRNAEVQVNSDSQVLNAILEIKNKCLALQEKKDDAIVKLNRKINELQDKINKDVKTRKTVELEFEKKTASFKFEIQKLKEQLAESEKKQKMENEKNVSLQKLLVEQVNDKYNLHRQHYKISEKQALFMVTYLKDLLTFLTPKSIPNDNICRQGIEVWENELRKVKGGLEQLNSFYQNVRVDIIKTDIYNTPWPEIMEVPRLEDNIIFNNFKAAIRNIIQTEEKLYWKYNTECQAQMQRPPTMAPINFPYNIQRAQFPPQNNIFVGPRLVYSNTPGVSVPLQYQPQMQQIPKKEKPPAEPTTLIVTTKELKPISQQNSRMSKSMEFLDKSGGTKISPVQACNRGTPKKGACTSKADNKKESDIILLDYVLERCSGATEEEVTLALLKLLEENKGTLSNLPKEKIADDVKIILRMKKQAAWVTPKSPHVDWHNPHTENECSICFEEFSLQDKYILPCQHEFHKECIKKWLKTSSVCPICRIHSVVDEEFPPLH